MHAISRWRSRATGAGYAPRWPGWVMRGRPEGAVCTSGWGGRRAWAAGAGGARRWPGRAVRRRVEDAGWVHRAVAAAEGVGGRDAARGGVAEVGVLHLRSSWGLDSCGCRLLRCCGVMPCGDKGCMPPPCHFFLSCANLIEVRKHKIVT